MQDNWMDILGDITNMMSDFEKLEKRIAPKLAEVQQNREHIAPELLVELDKAMDVVKARKSELKEVKKKIQDGNFGNS